MKKRQALPRKPRKRERMMSEEMIGFAAVVLVCSIPMAAIYAFYRVRKLKSEERLAAIAKGLNVPFEPELPHLQRSRRSGILLVCGGLGYSMAFALISLLEHKALIPCAFGINTVAIGLGSYIDGTLACRRLRPRG